MYSFNRLCMEMKKRMIFAGALGVKRGFLHYDYLLLVFKDGSHRAVGKDLLCIMGRSL